MGVGARQATADDARELTRLREFMLSAMGPVSDRSWWDPCVAAFRTALADPDGAMQAFVVDAPDEPGILASCSVGIVQYRLPSPHNPAGNVGHLMSVATDPRFRRQGYGRATVEATVEWLSRRGVDRVDLHASTDGEALYRRLGFHEPRGLALTRWAARPPSAP
jgi:ribosomal protein S18 acetylase RimI-like enzyme